MTDGDSTQSGGPAVVTILGVLALAFAGAGAEGWVKDGLSARAIGALLIATVLSFASFRWRTMRAVLGESFARSATNVATDFRWWMALLLVGFAYVATPRILRPPVDDLAGEAAMSGYDRKPTGLDDLSAAFRSLPRPCFLKVIAPSETQPERQKLVQSARDSGVPGIPNADWVIDPCNVEDDYRDGHPDKYLDSREYGASGIVVHAKPALQPSAEFIARAIRELGITVRVGTAAPDLASVEPEFRDQLILIEFGHGL